jgi:acyl-CoA reductase-like NAD-dependent aldehyde dehydrogenase
MVWTGQFHRLFIGGRWAPGGGLGQRGVGHEAGLEGFDAYVERRAIGIPSEFAAGLARADGPAVPTSPGDE